MVASSRVTGWLLNLALVVGVALVLVLGYAFVTGTVLSGEGGDQAAGVPPPHAGAVTVVPQSAGGDIVQVEVLNGCGTPDLAARATRHLRRLGFDVVEMGNYAEHGVEQTRVVDRIGDAQAAGRVVQALGLAESRLEADPRTDYWLDATVIAGCDFDTLATSVVPR